MRADNSHHLIASAKRRATVTRRRAVAALRRMNAAGTPITFDAVAREAGVSRAWLYTQSDLRTEIEQLRARSVRGTNNTAVPAQQRASDASLRRRLEAAIERNKRLEEDNRQLRDALARALGEQRTATWSARTVR
jgi:hypothetical protein